MDCCLRFSQSHWTCIWAERFVALKPFPLGVLGSRERASLNGLNGKAPSVKGTFSRLQVSIWKARNFTSLSSWKGWEICKQVATLFAWQIAQKNPAFKVISLFCTAHHLVCKSLRLHWWRSFSTLVLPLLTQNSGVETELVLIFTGRLKKCNYGPICSPNSFNSDFDNSTWLKRCLSWNSP